MTDSPEANAMSHPISLPAAAQQLDCPVWQLRRLYAEGLLPEAPRAGPYRLVDAGALPRIREVLDRRFPRAVPA